MACFIIGVGLDSFELEANCFYPAFSAALAGKCLLCHIHRPALAPGHGLVRDRDAPAVARAQRRNKDKALIAELKVKQTLKRN